MEVAPLSLDVHRLSPYNLIPASLDEPIHNQDVPPASSSPLVPPPPPSFSISPSPNYPTPYGTMSLGETFSLLLHLSNTSHTGSPVAGVRMMAEIQSPGGRYRLGEVIHGEGEEQQVLSEGQDVGDEETLKPDDEKFPILNHGDGVELDVQTEMKEMGLHVLICSVAWETIDGRRTFQRFFKFNVNPPLNIKTRPYTSSSANSALSPVHRQDVYLEVLTQNVSLDGMLFDRVSLEPVQGLTARPVTTNSSDKLIDSEAGPLSKLKDGVFDGALSTLMPHDTRQYLFVISPAPYVDTEISKLNKSVFPPNFSPGSVLPLGRLDVSWFSGPYREKGRLQTSTLNRRIPAAVPMVQRGISAPLPTRTMSAHPPSPASGVRRLDSPKPPPLPSKNKEDSMGWEFDLVVLKVDRKGVPVEEEFTMKLRIAVRSLPVQPIIQGEDTIPPPDLPLAVQYLSDLPTVNSKTSNYDLFAPSVLLSEPSRMPTPLPVPSPVITGSNNRPFSPLSVSNNTMSPNPASRPMTPVSSQLRHAASSHIGSASSTPATPYQPLSMVPAFSLPVPDTHSVTTEPLSFPPPPYLSSSPQSVKPVTKESTAGLIQHLGSSYFPLSPVKPFELVQEDMGTTYQDTTDDNSSPNRWEAVYEFEWNFMALQEGLTNFGGLRVLILDDESGSSGVIGREWPSLGDIWVNG